VEVERQLEMMEGDQLAWPEGDDDNSTKACVLQGCASLGDGVRGVPCPEAALTQTAPAHRQWLA
jgi:hypothetical protein